MILCTCKNCGSTLEIHENDAIPGCREWEDVDCPICHKEVTRVFTSGIPTVRVIRKGKITEE